MLALQCQCARQISFIAVCEPFGEEWISFISEILDMKSDFLFSFYTLELFLKDLSQSKTDLLRMFVAVRKKKKKKETITNC